MKTYSEILQAVKEYDGEMIRLTYNEYCISEGRIEECIYYMEDFDEVLFYYRPWEIAKAVMNGKFNPNHEYFWFNEDGTLESANSIDDKICIEKLADYRFKRQMEV